MNLTINQQSLAANSISMKQQQPRFFKQFSHGISEAKVKELFDAFEKNADGTINELKMLPEDQKFLKILRRIYQNKFNKPFVLSLDNIMAFYSSKIGLQPRPWHFFGQIESGINENNLKMLYDSCEKHLDGSINEFALGKEDQYDYFHIYKNDFENKFKEPFVLNLNNLKKFFASKII